jgi:hypothetical protein
MRSPFSALLATVFLMLASLPGLAASQRQSGQYQVKVPFDFMIGHYMFPAGEYTLQQTSRQTFMLRASQGITSLVISTRPVHRESSGKPAMLVFDRRQHHYVLLQFWTDSANGQRLTDRPFSPPQQPQIRTVSFTR